MAIQFSSAHKSNLLFDLNIWNQTCLPQYMNKSISFVPNKNITVETDDTQNVYVEHEDGQANQEYDPIQHVMKNSNEYES